MLHHLAKAIELYGQSLHWKRGGGPKLARGFPSFLSTSTKSVERSVIWYGYAQRFEDFRKIEGLKGRFRAICLQKIPHRFKLCTFSEDFRSTGSRNMALFVLGWNGRTRRSMFLYRNRWLYAVRCGQKENNSPLAQFCACLATISDFRGTGSRKMA